MVGSSAADFLAMSSCSRLLKATREVLAVDADRKRIGLYESSSPLVLVASVSTLGTAVHFLSAEQVDLCAIVLTSLPTIGGDEQIVFLPYLVGLQCKCYASALSSMSGHMHNSVYNQV